MIKQIIVLFPEPIKVFLRKNSVLLAWYTLVVNKSGYKRAMAFHHYDFFQTDGADPLYLNCIETHNSNIDSFGLTCVQDTSLYILPTEKNSESLSITITSVLSSTLPFSMIVVLTDNSSIELNKSTREKLQQSNMQLIFTLRLDDEKLGGLKNESIVVITEGDVLHPDYLFSIQSKIEDNTDIVYTDTDHLNELNLRCLPNFFPDWDPDFQLSTGYVNSGVWFKSSDVLLASKITNYDFILTQVMCELAVNQPKLKVQHIPIVLLHRPINLKGVFDTANIDYWHSLQQHAHVAVRKPGKVLSLKWHQTIQPLVSLIIPTKNGKELVKSCIDSIVNKTTYQHYEIILVDNNSDEKESLDYFQELSEHPQITVLSYPKPFNYSAINNFAAKHAKGEVIGLINNDIEVISSDWLDYMVGHVMRPEIGCVGAKLLFANGLVQHAGVVLGYGGGAGHSHKYFPRYHSGYLNRLEATHSYSAVTAACLLVTKDDFDAVLGLNEIDLTIAFNDVDFCLRILELGRRNLFCAEAELYHHESISRGAEDTIEKQKRFSKEVKYLQSNWGHYIEYDPAYNPNLTLKYENFSIK